MKWYKGRSEVKMWQKEQKMLATQEGYVRTLLGRERHFPKLENLISSQRRHIERAAINTPVQVINNHLDLPSDWYFINLSFRANNFFCGFIYLSSNIWIGNRVVRLMLQCVP
jgi:DNA polymerase family A